MRDERNGEHKPSHVALVSFVSPDRRQCMFDARLRVLNRPHTRPNRLDCKRQGRPKPRPFKDPHSTNQPKKKKEKKKRKARYVCDLQVQIPLAMAGDL
jgi:hypothetical protein